MGSRAGWGGAGTFMLLGSGWLQLRHTQGALRQLVPLGVLQGLATPRPSGWLFLQVPGVQLYLLGLQGWLGLPVLGVPCAELGVLEELRSGTLARSAEHISFWSHRLRCHQRLDLGA